MVGQSLEYSLLLGACRNSGRVLDDLIEGCLVVQVELLVSDRAHDVDDLSRRADATPDV